MVDKNDRFQDVPTHRKRWTKAREAAFLDHLAATCNVLEAAAVANMATSAVYEYRRRNPAFAAAWRAAILTGYDRLEAMLLARAAAATADVETAVQSGSFDPDLALRLIQMHDARLKAQAAGTARPQNRVKRATPEETDAAILKQLAALDRRMKAKSKA